MAGSWLSKQGLFKSYYENTFERLLENINVMNKEIDNIKTNQIFF